MQQHISKCLINRRLLISFTVIKTNTTTHLTSSAIGPETFVVNTSDLHATTDGNELCKYADDTYIIIPAVNIGSRSTEICNITDWACNNNLKLNLAKSQEIICVDKGEKQIFLHPP